MILERPLYDTEDPVTLRTWGTEDFALVRPLEDTDRSQWLSEELEPVNSTHLQPDQAGHGMLTG